MYARLEYLTLLPVLLFGAAHAVEAPVVFKMAQPAIISDTFHNNDLGLELASQNPIDLFTEITADPLADQYAINSDYHQTFSLPLSPASWNGFHFEIFSQLQDPDTYLYNNLQNNSVLKQTVDNHHDGGSWMDKDLSLGIGMGIPLWQRAQLQTMYSTAPLPGLGDANVVLGLMMDF